MPALPPDSHHPKVRSVRHWTADGLFSFTMDRPPAFRFEPGQFVMIGLPGENGGKPVMRAYSIVSPSWEDHLEFLSIKVPDGPLTSRLQHIETGDEIILGSKPTGTLVHSALTPGKNLFLLGTGTGLAPWLSIIRDPETYERFEHVYLCHGVRHTNELAYRDYLEHGIFEDETLPEIIDGGIKNRLKYYPTVTRDPDFPNQGRLTDLIESGKLFKDLGLTHTRFNAETDRIMVCGSVAMNRGMERLCEAQGMVEGATNHPGAFVVERAFVEKRRRRPSRTNPAPMRESRAKGMPKADSRNNRRLSLKFHLPVRGSMVRFQHDQAPPHFAKNYRRCRFVG